MGTAAQLKLIQAARMVPGAGSGRLSCVWSAPGLSLRNAPES
jgi:hypothetical protein